MRTLVFLLVAASLLSGCRGSDDPPRALDPVQMEPTEIANEIAVAARSGDAAALRRFIPRERSVEGILELPWRGDMESQGVCTEPMDNPDQLMCGLDDTGRGGKTLVLRINRSTHLVDYYTIRTD